MMRMGRRRRNGDFLAPRSKGVAWGEYAHWRRLVQMRYICKLEYRIDAT